MTKLFNKKFSMLWWMFGFGLFLIFASIFASGISDDITMIGFGDSITALLVGFTNNIGTIASVLVFGALFLMLTRLELIQKALTNYISLFQKRRWLLVTKLVFLFGLLGTMFLSLEMLVIFYPVFALVLAKSGFDKKTSAILMMFGFTGGLLTSVTNPAVFGLAFDTALKTGASFGYADLPIYVAFGIRFILFILIQSVVAFAAVRYVSKQSVEIKEVTRVKMTRKEIISLVLFALLLAIVIFAFLPMGGMMGIYGQGDFSDDITASNPTYWFGATVVWKLWAGLGFTSVASLSMAFVVGMIAIIILAMNHTELADTKGKEVEGSFSYKSLFGIVILITFGGAVSVLLSETGFRNAIAMILGMTGSTNLIVYAVVIFFVSLLLGMMIPSQTAFLAAFGQTLAVTVLFTWTFDTEAYYQAALATTMIAAMAGSGIAQIVSNRSVALRAILDESGMTYKEWMKETKWITISLSATALTAVIIAGALLNAGTAF